MENPTFAPQGQLFLYLEKTVFRNRNLCNELKELLGVSTSAIYKRVRGDIELSFSELMKISQAFEVSLDQFILPKHLNLAFKYDGMRKMPTSYTDYIQNIENHFSRLNGQPEVYFEFVATELPFFHFINFPRLAYFKLFGWNNAIWNFGKNYQKFYLKEFEKDSLLNETLQKLLSAYYENNGTEIWSDRLIDGTLKQIRYYLKTNTFANQKDALILIDDIRLLVTHLKRMCLYGKKEIHRNVRPANGEIKVYHSEFSQFSNTISVKNKLFSMVFLTMDSPNYLKCLDPSFCNYTQNWIDKLKQKSSLISKEGEKERVRLFRIIEDKIAATEVMVERHFSYD